MDEYIGRGFRGKLVNSFIFNGARRPQNTRLAFTKASKNNFNALLDNLTHGCYSGHVSKRCLPARHTARKEETMTITAKFPGTCNVCHKSIRAGAQIEWVKGKGSTHAGCVGKTAEPLNSPAPAEMIAPDADLVALVAQHGRMIDGDVQLISFSREGKIPARAGETFAHKGAIYVVLACSRPQYMSRSYLEDMDMFDREPGYWYDAQCVRVQPTEAEAEARATKQAAIEERKQLESSLRHSYSSETHIADAPADVTCTKVWGESRMGGSETWYVGSDGIVYRMASDYDMGPSWWRTSATPQMIERAKALGVKVV